MDQRGAVGMFDTLLVVWRTLEEWLFLVATGTLCVMALFVRKDSYKSSTSMEGRTVIVTGGSSGMGKEIARDLARRKARVIIAVCDLDQAKQASHEIFEDTRQLVLVKYLDLASLKSVREFAADILRTEERLDVLVNNAGVVLDSSEVKLTEDGYEKAFQTNYLGHFLLTMLLLDLLKKTAPSRIVNVSSGLYILGSMDHFEDRAKGNNPLKHPVAIYSNSKLAIILFTRALAEKLNSTGVTVNALHPGVVKTGITSKASGFVSSFFSLVQNIGGKTAQQGAKTSLFLAVDPKVEKMTGKYVDGCRPAWTSQKAADLNLAREIFRTSLKLVGLEEREL